MHDLFATKIYTIFYHSIDYFISSVVLLSLELADIAKHFIAGCGKPENRS